MSKTSEHKKLHLERALTQKTWNFMSVEGGSLTTIIMFGLTILCGSAFVLTHTAPLYSLLEAARRANDLDVYIATILVPAVWAVFTYGILFFLVPGVRYAVYKMINNRIEAENNAKLEYAARLANPNPDLAKQLDAARVLRIGGMASGPDKTVYTTEKDAIDQETDDDYRLPPAK